MPPCFLFGNIPTSTSSSARRGLVLFLLLSLLLVGSGGSISPSVGRVHLVQQSEGSCSSSSMLRAMRRGATAAAPRAPTSAAIVVGLRLGHIRFACFGSPTLCGKLRHSSSSAQSNRGSGLRFVGRPLENSRDSFRHPLVSAAYMSMSSRSTGDASAAAAAAAAEKVAVGSEEQEEQERRPVEGMVSSISHSALTAFRQCPQLFYYRHILRLRGAPTLHTFKGVVVHEVLYRFFLLEKESRELSDLHDLFEQVMMGIIKKENEGSSMVYRKLFESQEAEKKWAVECLDLLANFVRIERKREDQEKDPEHVELRMNHTFGGGGGGEGDDKRQQHGDDPPITTSAAADVGAKSGDDDGVTNAMSVTGIVDRLDRCSDGTLRVVDYKTGKVPDLKYSKATNKRIMDEKFFQLQIYALLVERALGEVPGEMSLVYLKEAKVVTRKIVPSELPSVEKDLRSAWDDIALAVQSDSFAPRTSRLCDWCSFQDRCPAFVEEEGG
ncbi:unnamed protein product [Pylaiella littoralis]